MYNIYFRNRVLTISKMDDPSLKSDDTIMLNPSDDYKLTDIPFMMEGNTSFKHLLVPSDQVEEQALFNQIFSKVEHIDAAGGLVINPQGQYLMIFRNGVWDLPKGKREEGEDIAITARREVREECGIDCVPEKLICITHHTYRLNKQLVLKHTYWYAMSVGSDCHLVPQTEEGIQKCAWVTAEEAELNLADSYLSIREVFECAGVV